MRSFVSVQKNRWTSPKDPRHAPPESAVHRSCPKTQNAKSAWPPSIHHRQPTWLVAISGAAQPPSASALRSLFVSRACRCSFSQSKGDAAATTPTTCLLPRAISPPMLAALIFCLASVDRLPSSTLHHRITHFANVLADLPMSCVVHRLSRAISAFSFF